LFGNVRCFSLRVYPFAIPFINRRLPASLAHKVLDPQHDQNKRTAAPINAATVFFIAASTSLV